MVDKEQITELYKRYFDPEGVTLEKRPIRILANGTVNATECWLVKDIAEIPIRFGIVKNNFGAAYKRLETLRNFPRVVKGSCWVSNNKLKDLKGAPEKILDSFHIDVNPLESLEGFPQQVGAVYISWSANLPMLRCLNAQRIVVYRQPKIQMILNRYAGQGEAGAFECGAELASAGFKENARW
jgi:hypothetical protein